MRKIEWIIGKFYLIAAALVAFIISKPNSLRKNEKLNRLFKWI